MKDRIIKWIQQYFDANASSSSLAIVGISGGKDSNVCATLCKRALGTDRVLGVMMPNGKQRDFKDAEWICEYLDIARMTLDIKPIVEKIYDILSKNQLIVNTMVTHSVPARIRMVLLYALAAATNGRVCNTSNASEIFIGWTTKWGDNIGDFSPLGRLTCSEVIALGDELELPAPLVYKKPEDGMSDKFDEEQWKFTYEALDKYITTGVFDSITTVNNIMTMRRYSEHKRCVTIPTFYPAH